MLSILWLLGCAFLLNIPMSSAAQIVILVNINIYMHTYVKMIHMTFGSVHKRDWNLPLHKSVTLKLSSCWKRLNLSDIRTLILRFWKTFRNRSPVTLSLWTTGDPKERTSKWMPCGKATKRMYNCSSQLLSHMTCDVSMFADADIEGFTWPLRPARNVTVGCIRLTL